MGLANYPFVYTAQQDVCFLHNSRTLWIHVQFVICCNSQLLSYGDVVFLCYVFVHTPHMAVHFHAALVHLWFCLPFWHAFTCPHQLHQHLFYCDPLCLGQMQFIDLLETVLS